MRMKQLALTFLARILVWSGCMEKDVYQSPQEKEKEYNEFNFSTVAPTTSLEKNKGCPFRLPVSGAVRKGSLLYK